MIKASFCILKKCMCFKLSQRRQAIDGCKLPNLFWWLCLHLLKRMAKYL
uniref:Uncharacterized protein n=1 Tax=Rhizophora mucronata TaxID=61149 RepID=A0A2P2PY95_RHIMU